MVKIWRVIDQFLSHFYISSEKLLCVYIKQNIFDS